MIKAALIGLGKMGISHQAIITALPRRFRGPGFKLDQHGRSSMQMKISFRGEVDTYCRSTRQLEVAANTHNGVVTTIRTG
jgi:hypothetical protein